MGKGNRKRGRLRSLGSSPRAKQRARRLLLPLLGALPVAVVFEASGVVKALEEPLVRVVAHQSKVRNSFVEVVQITDDDFRDFFQSRRPFSPDKLAQVVDAISSLGPRAIAVDIDTSDPMYRTLAIRTAAGGPPVVWGRRAAYSHGADVYYVENVLGGSVERRSGVTALIPDSDQEVRTYRRSFHTDLGEIGLLPVELLRAAGMLENGNDPGERLIDFYGYTSGEHRRHWSVNAVLRASADNDVRRTLPLKGKVVLFGGVFRGLDEHQTPLGWMYGLELLAHIAESDAKNVAPTTRIAINAITLAGALLIALCFELLSRKRAVLASLTGMAVGFLISWWYTHLSRDAILVGAVFFVILCQQIYAKFIKPLIKRPEENVVTAASM